MSHNSDGTTESASTPVRLRAKIDDDINQSRNSTQVTGTQVTDTNGNIKFGIDTTNASGLIGFKWDFISVARTSLTDTFTYRTEGSLGTTVGTLVITYTNTGKEDISTVALT